jgi:hypothetical protein
LLLLLLTDCSLIILSDWTIISYDVTQLL